MATKVLNRVGMLISTTGTGTITAAVPISNKFNTPAEAGAVDGEQYFWLLEEGNDFELFRGSWTLSGTTISRDEVIESKIGGVHGTTKMTLTGGATLRSAVPKEALRSGWTLIEEIAATSGNSKVFDNIPDSFSDLYVVGTGLQPSKSGSTQAYISLSTTNGASYDALDDGRLFATLTNGSSAYGSNMILAAQTALPLMFDANSISAVQYLPDVISARIDAIRIDLDQSGGASNFTTGGSGVLRLYGR